MLRRQVAGMLIRDGQVLLCLRSATRCYFPGVWDLPGGHREANESDRAALRRELHEELGIVVPEPPRPAMAHIVDPARGFALRIWAIRDWAGVPANRLSEEHEALGWFAPAQIPGLPLALPRYPALIRRAIAAAA